MYTPFSPNTIISSFTNPIFSLKFANNTPFFPYKKSGRSSPDIHLRFRKPLSGIRFPKPLDVTMTANSLSWA